MKSTQPTSGLARFRSAFPGLSPKLQTVAAHIVEHPQDVMHLSISELAEVTGCAEATIFRLCRQLGFKGYQEMKIFLARELVEQPMQNIHEEVNRNDGMRTVAEKIFHANVVGITDTLQLLDDASLGRAVKLLDEAKNTAFYALGGSAPIALDAYHKFIRAGLNCVTHSDAHMQVMTAAIMDKESVVVGISHSGSSKDLLEAVRVAKRAGAQIIAITSYPKSPLAQLADVKLYTSTRETSFRPEAMSARIAQLCVVDVLYVGLSLMRQEETLSNLDKIREVISVKRL